MAGEPGCSRPAKLCSPVSTRGAGPSGWSRPPPGSRHETQRVARGLEARPPCNPTRQKPAQEKRAGGLTVVRGDSGVNFAESFSGGFKEKGQKTAPVTECAPRRALAGLGTHGTPAPTAGGAPGKRACRPESWALAAAAGPSLGHRRRAAPSTPRVPREQAHKGR